MTRDLSLTRRKLGLGAAASFGAAPAAASGFGNLADRLDARVATGDPPGLVALIARGEAVWTHASGLRDVAAGAPMARDTVFAIASAGKPLTAVSALQLVEDGVLGLDSPVDRWLPELRDRSVLRDLAAPLDDTVPARRAITLRDLLTCRMGLGAVFADPAGAPVLSRMAELELAPGPRLFGHGADEFMRRIGTLPLVHQPGERWLYHSGLDVAGVLVARASGMSLEAFQRERIFAPLGMADTGFSAPAARLATVYRREGARLVVHNPASGTSFAEPPPFQAGGGGQVATVDDLLAFGRMLLGGGAWRGRRVLSEASVREMLTDQVTPEQKAASPFFPGFWEAHGWGLGIGLVKPAPTHAPGSRARFGWWGGFGTTFFADAGLDTVALLFTGRIMAAPDDAALGAEVLRHAFGDRV